MESQNIEYKQSWKDEYLKWICGFANAQGGTLYIGIDDNKNVVGVDNAKYLLDNLPNKCIQATGIVSDFENLTQKGEGVSGNPILSIRHTQIKIMQGI